MGTQIVELLALSGVSVVARDADRGALERAVAAVCARMGGRVARGRLSALDAQARMGLIATDPGEAALDDVDLAIEAVPERVDVKREVLAAIEGRLPSGAIVASNTSSLSIGELAGALAHPERFIGMHFFHPVAAMRLVEVVRHRVTDPQVVAASVRFLRDLGKQPIVLKDTPGFIVNRVLMAAMAEALRYQEDTGLDAQSIDEALVAAGALPVGPFALADALGLDVVLEVQQRLVAALGSRFAGGRLRELVAQGRLGCKSGEGFYRYAGPGSGP